MPSIKDMLPVPPWEGPPIPRILMRKIEEAMPSGNPGEVKTQIVGEEAGTTEVERFHGIEYGTEKVELDIVDSISDPMTLREMALDGKLKDGLYEGGDDFVYRVTGEKVELLSQYRAKYNYETNEYEYTIKTQPEALATTPIFHGSVADELNLHDLTVEKSGQNFAGVGGNEFRGIYFTTIPSDAKGYTRLSKGKGTLIEARIAPDANVIEYKEAMRRIKVIEEKGLTYVADTEPLLAQGVDVVLKYKKGGEIGEVIVINPEVLLDPTFRKPVIGKPIPSKK